MTTDEHVPLTDHRAYMRLLDGYLARRQATVGHQMNNPHISDGEYTTLSDELLVLALLRSNMVPALVTVMLAGMQMEAEGQAPPLH
jgi:hypothetical protein